MAHESRALFKLKDGELRRFLSIKIDASAGVNISSARGVPGIMHESGDQYAIEVPAVDGLHLSVHGDGRVHIRQNGGGAVYDRAQYPPLRDLAAPTYVMEIHPARLNSYPLLDKPRAGDQEIDVSAVEESGFAVAVAVWGPRGNEAPKRRAYPGIVGATGKVEMRHSRHVVGPLEFQVAVLSVPGQTKSFNDHDEWWRLLHPTEPGDALPRPWGGALNPPQWQVLGE